MTVPSHERARAGTQEWTAIGVVLALVLSVSVVLAVVFPPPSHIDRLPEPPSGPDLVRTGPIVSTFPAACGIQPATVARLVPRARLMDAGGTGGCRWAAGDDSGRYLLADIVMSSGFAIPTPASVGAQGRSPLGAAIKTFGPRWPDIPVQPVTGLGDEAIVQSSPTHGATLVTRVGNMKAVVQFNDTERSLSREAALDGAFAGAVDVVRAARPSLRTHPAIGTLPARRPARRLPDLCQALPGGTLKRLMKDGAFTSDAKNARLIEASQRSGCAWTSRSRELTVSMTALLGNALSDGARQATREYLARHCDARAEETLSVRDKKYFRAVTGLGDQAFAAYVPGVNPGQLLFRDGNVLVEVSYEAADDREQLTRKEAIRAAYTVAQSIARAMPAS